METSGETLADGSRYYESEGDEFGAPGALVQMLNGYDLTPHEIGMLYQIAQRSGISAIMAGVHSGVPPSMLFEGQFISGLALGMHLRDITIKTPPDAEDPSVPDDMKG